jgi:predicted flavoprotein YhiN
MHPLYSRRRIFRIGQMTLEEETYIRGPYSPLVFRTYTHWHVIQLQSRFGIKFRLDDSGNLSPTHSEYSNIQSLSPRRRQNQNSYKSERTWATIIITSGHQDVSTKHLHLTIKSLTLPQLGRIGLSKTGVPSQQTN